MFGFCKAQGQSPAPDAAKVLELAHSDVVSSSETAVARWLSYLFLLFYLAVAASGITHRDLLVESPVTLPFLSVNLPLVGFFRVVPPLFVLVHTYVLLHLVFLSERIIAFQRIAPVGPKAIWQLPANVLVKALAESGSNYLDLTGWLIRMIARASLIVGPVLLLVFMQLQFLPYHDVFTTWLQRVTTVVDIVLLWSLWPRIVRRRPSGSFGWIDFTRLGRWTVASLAVLFMVFGIATFPGETLHDVSFVPFRNTIVAEQVQDATSRAASPFVNRLVLSGADLVDRKTLDSPAKLYAAPPIQNLRGRHLEGAIFTDASMPRVDFTNAYLDGAVFTRAKLQGSWFDAASMIGVRLDNAQAQGASFFNASLQAASLERADLQGAVLAGTNLGGAVMTEASLQGASLAGADLRGSSLVAADLRGAILAGALLQGASFQKTNLTGASFFDAYIWRTDFRLARAESPGLRIVGPRPESAKPPCMSQDPCRPPDDVDRLSGVIDRFVPDPKIKGAMMARLEQKLEPGKPIPLEDAIKESAVLVSNPDTHQALVEADLAKLWLSLACTADGAPFVLMGFLDTISDDKAVRFKSNSSPLRRLAHDLDGAGCAGKTVMADATRMKLLEQESLPAEPSDDKMVATNMAQATSHKAAPPRHAAK